MKLSSHGVVCVVRDQENRFLLLEDGRPEMRGYWAPPHGCCDLADVTEEATVIRETFEETGMHVRPLRKLLTQDADTKVKTVSFWTVNITGGEMIIDSSETSRHGWFAIDEVMKLKLYPGTLLFFDKVRAGDISLD